jgi:transposase
MACVIHSTSVAVSRERRRAKTDRLDTELSHGRPAGYVESRVVVGGIPTIEEEDGKRLNRERCLGVV